MADEWEREIEALWLDALHQVAGRAAHEIKGALNGVCVNLEVVRSRASAQSGQASSVARFADAAWDQLETLVAMNEALLALARRPRDVVDVAATASQLLALLGPAARSEGAVLEVVGLPTKGGGATSAPATAVRLVLASAMLRALDQQRGGTREAKGTTGATCRVDAADGMVIRLECIDGGPIELDPRVVQIATDCGIQIENDGGTLSVAFPRAGRSSGRRSTPTRELA